MHSRLLFSTSDRRSITVAAVVLCVALGLVCGAFFHRIDEQQQQQGTAPLLPASSFGVKRTGRRTDGSLPRSSSTTVPSHGRFLHILEDSLDVEEAPATGNKLTAWKLNELRHELRRLKKPIKMLIQQLDPTALSIHFAKKHSAAPENGKMMSPNETRSDTNRTKAPLNGDLAPPPPVHIPLTQQLMFHKRWTSRPRSIFVPLFGFAWANMTSLPSGGPSCRETVDSVFETAASPENVHVGLVEVYPDDVDLSVITPLPSFGCVNPKYALCNQSLFCAIDHIRVRRVHRRNVRGVQHLVALAAQMYRSESFTLIAHNGASEVAMQLPRQWDELLQSQWRRQSEAAQRTASADPEKLLLTGSGVGATPCGLSLHPIPKVKMEGNVSSSTVVWSMLTSSKSLAVSDGALPTVQVMSTSFLFGPSRFLRVPLATSVNGDLPHDLYHVVHTVRLFAQGYVFVGAPISLSFKSSNSTAMTSVVLPTASADDVAKYSQWALGMEGHSALTPKTQRRLMLPPVAWLDRFWNQNGHTREAILRAVSVGEHVDLKWCGENAL